MLTNLPLWNEYILKSNNDKNDTDRFKQEFVASDNINLKRKKVPISYLAKV